VADQREDTAPQDRSHDYSSILSLFINAVSPGTVFAAWCSHSMAPVHKYPTAVKEWHIVQGWPSPLSGDQRERINWSLRGMAKLQAGRHRKPLQPPVTTSMIKNALDIDSPFNVCVWAISTCVFWGMMRLGEATVKSHGDFHPSKCLTLRNAVQAADQYGHRYVRLDLPAAKTAKPGASQSIWLVPQGKLCAMKALHNEADPLFS